MPVHLQSGMPHVSRLIEVYGGVAFKVVYYIRISELERRLLKLKQLQHFYGANNISISQFYTRQTSAAHAHAKYL